MITSGLLFGIFDRHSLWNFPYPISHEVFPLFQEIDTFGLGSTSWIRVGGRLIRVSDQSDQRSDKKDMDSHIVTIDQFVAAMAFIQKAIASLDRMIDGQ